LKPGTALFPSEAKPEPLIDALLNQVSGAVCILRLPDLSLMGMSAKASQLIGCSASNWAGLREDLLARGDGDSAGQTRTFRCHRQHHALFQLNYVSRLLAYGEGFCLFLTFTEQSTYPAACVLDTPAQDEYLRVLTAALQKSRGAILLTDAQGTVTYANEAYKQLTGYEDSDIIGKQPGASSPDFHTSEQYQGCVWLGDIQGHKKNGEIYWASGVIVPLGDSAGERVHYAVIQRDITDCVNGKEALRESEERFRAVTEMVGEWLWEQDAEGRYTWTSATVTKVLGLQPGQILGKHYLDFLIPKACESLPGTVAVNRDNKNSFRNVVNRYMHREGYEVYTHSSGAPVFDEKGHLVKWRGVDQDITASKQVEDILRTQERAMESASVGIAICDARQSGFPVIYANPALCAITGYSREELTGTSLRILQGAMTDPAAIETIRITLKKGLSCKLHICNYRKNGTPFWNELLLSPVRDPEGVVSHYVGIQSDITEQRLMSEERHQLELARNIQLSLLPKKPMKVSGMELAGICLPAAQVGGDYFDYFYRADWLDIVIADVSGHNVGAALIMTELRSALKAGLYLTDYQQSDYSPAYFLWVLNELLYDDLNNAELFISMFYLRYNITTRTLYYANAGHNKVMLARHGFSNHQVLDAEGMILGVKRSVNFEECSMVLEPGDRLLMYTDGVIETQDVTGQFFGENSLARLFLDNSQDSPQQLLKTIEKELTCFASQSDFRDDITLVTATVTASP
jgi:sigma-B regulation protein RsbU (phosphoserine phosphatase)